jgi:hypothetical protein
LRCENVEFYGFAILEAWTDLCLQIAPIEVYFELIFAAMQLPSNGDWSDNPHELWCSLYQLDDPISKCLANMARIEKERILDCLSAIPMEIRIVEVAMRMCAVLTTICSKDVRFLEIVFRERILS